MSNNTQGGTIITQYLTDEQVQLIENAIAKLTPIYEKAMGREIQPDEISLLWATYSGCFMKYRGGEEEMNEILNSNIKHWSNYTPKKR